MRISRWMMGLALAGMMMVPMKAESQTTLTPDTWFSFSWSGLGAISQQFWATTSTLQVIDCCVVGDMFEVFANAGSVGTTSAVDASSGAYDGSGPDAAWANGLLSKGTFSVSAGDLISLSTIQLADGHFSGGGYIRSVPEPGTVLLFGVGLFGLAFVGKRREDVETA